uniref:Uncharacterized protein n=1 Tax=Sarcophilus harrisii TaxID=9305 RepID=A0A7N4NLK2_SARHA
MGVFMLFYNVVVTNVYKSKEEWEIENGIYITKLDNLGQGKNIASNQK